MWLQAAIPHPFAIEERIMADVPAWNAKGEWFDVCRCNVPCPCSWAQPPDDDYCDGVLVWHIREGRYGDVALDGLNVVAFASFKGNLWEGAHSDPRWASSWTSARMKDSVRRCR
jgi:hypothetical protein